MGLSCQKPAASVQQKNKPLEVFICGLNSSGKSTVFYSIKSDKSYPMITTFDVETEITVLNNISMAVMDEGGRTPVRVRTLHPRYYSVTSGFIFVIDSNDRERIDEARQELHRLSNIEELRNKSFLILANKQDLLSAMTLDELRDKLNWDNFDGNTKWHLQPTCAIHDEGIHEGLTWLANSMVEKVDLMEPIVETFNDTTKIQNYLKSILTTDNLKTFLHKFV